MEYKKRYEKECPICKSIFVTGTDNQHYCSKECQREGYLSNKRINDKVRREMKKAEKEMPNKTEDLVKAEAKAREAGMSYGKYYEKLYIERMRVKK